MMDDQDLEARLRAYHPVGPPPELRACLAEARTDGGRSKAGALAWLPAVAAMLLAATLYWLAAIDRQRVFAQLQAPGAAQSIDVSLEPQP